MSVSWLSADSRRISCVNSPWDRSQSRAVLKYFNSSSFYLESTLENFERPNSDKVFIKSFGCGADRGRVEGDVGALLGFFIVGFVFCSFLLWIFCELSDSHFFIFY